MAKCPVFNVDRSVSSSFANAYRDSYGEDMNALQTKSPTIRETSGKENVCFYQGKQLLKSKWEN
jgi:hypothetical protein